ncbi:MAG: PEP-CTERM sorting domain-containing protein [Nitrospiria bacterium]
MKNEKNRLFLGLRSLGGLFLVFGLLFAGSSTALAGSTLHIGFGAGTTCAIGCGGDPNLSPGYSNIFDVYQTSGGASSVNPVLLIIGVPNQNAANFFSNSSITNLTSINAYPGGTTVSSNPYSYLGYQGSLTAGKEVYGDILGLTGANNSNSFTNWQSTDLTDNTINAASFGIYEFSLGAGLGSKGLLNITFANNVVPVGSYVIAYAGGGRKFYDTPFTEAGLETGCCNNSVPEPSSLLLIGSSLIGLAIWGRKKSLLN